jgi:uracil-DNA glycosylase
MNTVKSKLAELYQILDGCQKCPLSETRTNIVFGVGNSGARVVFVGEGPGEYEDIRGVPFVGRSGKLLDKIISAMGLDRYKDTYICNVVKCRPPGNRVPTSEEMRVCGDFLKSQLVAILPRVVVTLGSTATGYLLGDVCSGPISKLCGRVFNVDIGGNKLEVVPTYHPSYVLRRPMAKEAVWKHMQVVMRMLRS